MKLGRFWVVRNPGPHSKLGDICWQTNDVDEFADYVLGTPHGGFRREEHAIYTEQAEAEQDAHARLVALVGVSES